MSFGCLLFCDTGYNTLASGLAVGLAPVPINQYNQNIQEPAGSG
jgi:hypothetical protein